MCEKTVVIGGVEYTPKTEVAAKSLSGMPYVIIRAHSAGVFAGYLESRNGQEVVMRQSRRLWYWSGAASLSQLAVDGVAKPKDCKFPVEIDRHEITGVAEVIHCTEKARLSIGSVAIWKM